MPLKLVTGPANAAKAGAVLGPLRDRLREEPVLVVPSFEDVEHSQRELAERGAVFGARVLRFKWLYALIAERAGYVARVASDLQRRLIAEQATREADLQVLAASAERPGFARAAERFVAELENSMVEAPRFIRAMRDWAGDGPRRRYADEVGEIYRRYREGLEAAGLVDSDLFAWRALEALAREPDRWGGTPVFFYGFDDFTPLEREALRVLADRAEADVTVSLPYEPGREAFRATATLREELVAMGAEVTHLEAISDHYADASRPALHALERGLFETVGGEARPGDAVRVHVAGGERAELELCGAAVLELLREGTAPGDIAVVMREPARYGSLVEQVFGAYGIPYSIDRSLPLAHTGLGRGLLALLRSAGPRGTAEDLLAYLRTPGLLREAHLADRLEAEVRQAGEAEAKGARELWEKRRWPLDELDAIARAEGADLLAVLRERLRRLFEGPYRRRAHVLQGAELDDARAFRAAEAALTEMIAVVGADRRVRLDADRIHATLAELPVRVGENPQPDRVQVAAPGDVRARRFEAVFVCGLQEREFPRRSAPDAFLPDADRAELAKASGLRLPLHEDYLARERYLFYVCASRAERLLVLSSRYCDEEGNPESPSFFLEDARAVFAGALEDVEQRRSLADVTWSLEDAPTDAEWERAVARRGPRRAPAPVGPIGTPAALSALDARDTVSAGALEDYASCPVKWLVEKVLRPDTLEPDPEPMVRGSYAHRVLEATLTRLAEATGSMCVTRENLAEAERIMQAALTEFRGEFRLSPNQVRVRAAVTSLEFDLLRYLRWEAERDSDFTPAHLELRFGFDDSDHPPVRLPDGTSVRGVIDRIDTWDGHAVVVDYKSGKVADYKAANWDKQARFQAALYMLVAEEVLGLKPAGGVYTPLGGDDRRARGALDAALADHLGEGYVGNDVLASEDFAELNHSAREKIGVAAAGMRAGALCSTPDSCAYRGGCSHPSICRVEAQ